jgi:hypothetical protein
MRAALTIGVISDTHGLLRPEALQAMHGCDYIIHASMSAIRQFSMC